MEIEYRRELKGNPGRMTAIILSEEGD